MPDNKLFDLTIEQFAVFELTNSDFTSREYPIHYPLLSHPTGIPFILTTKDIYLWGVILAKIVEKRRHINSREIINAYHFALKNNRQALKDNYERLNFDSTNSENNLRSLILSDFVRKLEFDNDLIENSKKLTIRAYEDLVEKEIIEDPLAESILGISIAVVGFIPYGFTKKTRKGKTIERKIKALFWEYEYRNSKDVETKKFYFRLLKILSAFKAALVEVTEEEAEFDDD